MVLDKEQQRITCAYPFNGKEKHQVSNYSQALVFQKSVEKQLEKQGIAPQYKQEMEKMLDSGVARELSEEETSIHNVTEADVKQGRDSSRKLTSGSRSSSGIGTSSSRKSSKNKSEDQSSRCLSPEFR